MFGIPPVRAGGLVRYAMDLMQQELQMGVDVCLLIPGAIPKNTRKKTKVIKSRKTDMCFPVYAIYHPLPVPMCNGILDIKGYTKTCDGSVFRSFLQELQPDLIHIHTFMGLYREFLVQARKMGIPVLFTTHDYFGICPTAIMLRHGHLCEDQMWKNCSGCCKNAFSKNRLWLEQSEGYRLLRKQDWMAARIKRISRAIPIRRKKAGKDKNRKQNYAVLKRYYASMFELVSWFHFNSTLAKKIYESRLGIVKGSVLNISHSGIGDHRRAFYYGKKLRLGYFGSWANHKGFFVLLKACSSLYEQGCIDLELHLYSSTENRKETFVRMHPNFAADQLGEVFCDMDVLVMPSIWPETFGLSALEAVSYGVPVIVSEHTGAMDILRGHQQCKTEGHEKRQDVSGSKCENDEKLQDDFGSGFVYDGTQSGLEKVLREIYDHREWLEVKNACIRNTDYDFSFQGHVQEMIKMYQKLIKWKSKNIGRKV